jgi:hypothetical protein
MAELVPPIPNLTIISECLVHYIANHPLIINPIVKHRIKGNIVGVNAWRTFDGYEVRNGLTCSVFPYPGAGGGIPGPNSTSTSGWFETIEIGQRGQDLARFNIVVKYSYNEVLLGKTVEMKVPTSSIFGVGQKMLTSTTKKDVILEVNPGIDIIQDYLAITKVIVDDAAHKKDFPIPVKSFEVKSFNVKSKRWEEDDTIYFQEGVAMILMEAYVAKGWRDSLLPFYAQRPSFSTTLN